MSKRMMITNGVGICIILLSGWSQAAESKKATLLQQAIACIQQKDTAGAEAAIAQVRAAYASQPEVLVPALVELAEAWDVRHGRNQAKALFADVVQKYPGSPEAKLLNEVSAVADKIERGQVAEAGEAVDRLYGACGAHASLRWRLVDLAERWENNGHYERADQLRQRVIKDYPDSPQARMAQLTWDASQLYRKIERRESDSVFEEVARWERDYKELGETVMWKILGAAGRLNDHGGKTLSRELYVKLARDYAGTTPGNHGVNYLHHEEICAQIRQGAYDAAQAQIEAMMARDAGNPDMYELPWRLRDYAYLWEEFGQKDRARALKLRIAANFKGFEHGPELGLQAVRDGIYDLMDQGDQEGVNTALTQMEKDFIDHPELLAWRLLDIANRYEEKGDVAEGTGLRQLILDEYAATLAAKEAGLILTTQEVHRLIQQGMYDQAQAAISKMRKAHEGQSGLEWSLLGFAGAFRDRGEKDRAQAIYVDMMSRGNFAGGSAMAELYDVPRLIQEGKTEEVEHALSNMRKDNTGSASLPFAFVPIAETYYYAGRTKQEVENMSTEATILYQKAIACWQDVKGVADSHFAALAYWGEGDCYYRLNDIPNTIKSYQKLLEAFPHYNAAWAAQYLVGKCYQELGRKGLMDQEEARLEALDAYQQVVEKYPHCDWAEQAKNQMDILMEKTTPQ